MSITLFRPGTGEQFPVDGIQSLRNMLASGAATYDDFCFYPGAQDWKRLRELQITDSGLVPLPPLPGSIPVAPLPNDTSTTGQHSHTLELGLTVQTRHNVLAYIAFALGCLSFLFAALAAIPGVICGHVALRQCDADPALLGRAWARTGLILSYIIVIANLLLVVGGALFYLGLYSWAASHKP